MEGSSLSRAEGNVALGASDAGSSLEGSSLSRALSGGLLLLKEESPVGEFGSVFAEGIGGNNRDASVLGSSTLGITVAGP